MTAPPPRDWDQELAEIDKLISKMPAGGAGAPAKPQPQARAPLPAAPARGRREVWGTWARVLLGVVLGLAVTQWPYPNRCGVGLFLHAGVVGLVALAGFWAAVVSWRRRMGLAHVVSLGVLLWGLGLGAAMLLPRTGYAREQLTWWC